MANKKFLLGILVMVLVLGMSVVGCDNGSTGGDNGDNGGQTLPAASGVNEVNGKTYYAGSEKVVFSATADGATNGTFSISESVWDEENHDYELVNGKYKYIDSGTGTYTWNENAKTVTFKPEKIFGSFVSKEATWIDETAYRKYWQAMLDSAKKEMGEKQFNEQLSSMGYSNATAYINYMVSEVFSLITESYSFSTDGRALFLEQALPANKGVNELSGQTYYYGYRNYNEDTDEVIWDKYENQKYVFTVSGYTYTSRWETVTGSYAYDSNRKWIWLRPSTIDGKDRAAYYAEQTVDSENYFADDYTYRAAYTNSIFGNRSGSRRYDSKNKVLYEDK